MAIALVVIPLYLWQAQPAWLLDPLKGAMASMQTPSAATPTLPTSGSIVPAPLCPTVRVSANRVNLRAEPGLHGAMLRKLAAGEVLTDYAEAGASNEVERLRVFDPIHDNYLLVNAGWNGMHRIHSIVAHLRVHNGKVWVEADNTNTALVQQLLDAGLTKDDIVLAFYSAQKRPFTEFAAA